MVELGSCIDRCGRSWCGCCRPVGCNCRVGRIAVAVGWGGFSRPGGKVSGKLRKERGRSRGRGGLRGSGNGKEERKAAKRVTHNRVDFIHDGALCGFNGTSGTDETDVPLDVATIGLGDVDLAAAGLLHVLDCFAA